MNNVCIFLTLTSVLMFQWNCISTVFMTEDWQHFPFDSILMFMTCILGLTYAASQGWMLPSFMFGMTTAIGIINVRIRDGFIVQRVTKLYREAIRGD